MGGSEFDVVVVGGGVAGSALAYSMAKSGARVLVLERETEFKDRVRGEAMVPWGVAEAEQLGLLPVLKEAGAHELTYLNQFMFDQQFEHRNLRQTGLYRRPVLTMYHPTMQEALLAAAQTAGADVRRGVTAESLTNGDRPGVRCGRDQHNARLIVLSDGRNSSLRKAAGFTVKRDPETLLMAGIFLDGISLPEGDAFVWTNPAAGKVVACFPQGRGKARAYSAYPVNSQPRLQGDRDLQRLFDGMAWIGESCSGIRGARPAGPLASFDCTDAWVEHPCRDGIALLGDTAGVSDPSWGQGLSISFRDVRVLRDCLLSDSDWNAAGEAYARERSRYFNVVHTVSGWMTEMFHETGLEADRRRAHALPLIGQDPTRLPDLIISGPDVPIAENARARMFGEDVLHAAGRSA